eukprot:1103437-Amphidinium_carterae.1
MEHLRPSVGGGLARARTATADVWERPVGTDEVEIMCISMSCCDGSPHETPLELQLFMSCCSMCTIKSQGQLLRGCTTRADACESQLIVLASMGWPLSTMSCSYFESSAKGRLREAKLVRTNSNAQRPK